MKIAILWYWKEWKSTHNFLKKQWFKDITILDKSLDKNYLENLEKYDIIYKTPWISIYLPQLQRVKDKIKTQADILFENFKWKLILISWSKWKSTTSTLIYEILKNAWKSVKLVWNIWNPILSELDFDNLPEYIVFEISSYMLDSTKNIWSTYSILTNIYKVHTNWHKEHKNYVNAKLRLFENNKFWIAYIWTKDIINKENIIYFWEDTDYFFNEKFIYSPKYKFNINEVKLEWKHNYLNICSILPICEKENIAEKDIEQTLKQFQWLRHRQEFIAEIDGVKYYNDSIATIPESVLQVLERFEENLDTIILWWEDNNFDYTKVINKLNKMKVQNIVLLPNSLERQKHLFKNKNIFEVDSLEKAVKIAKEKTRKWKVCVLSPGAPSLNMFKNFEQRWDLFRKYVLEK